MKNTTRTPSAPPDAWHGERYKVRVEVAVGMGGRRRPLYRLTICRGFLCYGPEYTHCWYGRNPDRLQRKGDRIAARLNHALDRDEMLVAQRKETR